MHLPSDVLYSFLTHLALVKLSVARHYDLNLRQFLLLGVLAPGEQLSFNIVGKLLGLPKSAVTGLVDSLCGRGLLERRQSSTDHRRWLVSLTPLGTDLTQKIQHEEAALLHPLMEPLLAGDGHNFVKAVQNLTGELADSRQSVARHQRGRASKS